jgi:hypothetical protein
MELSVVEGVSAGRAASGSEAVLAELAPSVVRTVRLVVGSGSAVADLELEPENRDPDTGELREVRCFSLAAKRYAL